MNKQEKLLQNRADNLLMVQEIQRIKQVITNNHVSDPLTTILYRYQVDLQMQYRINESTYQTLQGL